MEHGTNTPDSESQENGKLSRENASSVVYHRVPFSPPLKIRDACVQTEEVPEVQKVIVVYPLWHLIENVCIALRTLLQALTFVFFPWLLQNQDVQIARGRVDRVLLATKKNHTKAQKGPDRHGKQQRDSKWKRRIK